MRDLLPYIVAGISTGSLGGLAATGLVLTYKTSGVFNFAQGALAAACAYAFHELRVERSLPWPVALALTVLVVAPLLGQVVELVARRLVLSDVATRIVATIGLMVAIQGIAQRIYGAAPLAFPPFISTSTFTVADVRVGYDQLTILLTSIGCVAALFVFFRASPMGLQMRAVVDNAELLGLVGRSPVRVRRWAWAVGCAFAGLSGILLSSIVGLNIMFLTLLTVQAFGAAAVGRFQNLVVTFAAAVGIGVVGELVKKYIPEHDFLAGLPASLPFIVLFGVLLLSPAGRFREREPRRQRARSITLPAPARWAVALGSAAFVVFLPDIVGTRLAVYTNGAIFVVLFVSLALLVQMSGQVSLCQLSFAAVSATTFSHLTQGLGLPWGLAFLLASLVSVPIGALLSVPAIRLSSLYLALATFGFAILLEQLVFPTALMFGGLQTRIGDRPHALGLDGDRGYFYLCALVAAASVVLAMTVRRSRLGRLLGAIADSPIALATHGANVNVTRVLAFCLSAFLAGAAGVLFMSLTGSARGNGVTFSFFQSLMLLVVLALSGRSIVVAPIVAAFLFAVAPSYSTSPSIGTTQQITFGVVTVLVTVIGPALRELAARAAPMTEWRRRSGPVADRLRLSSAPPATPSSQLGKAPS